MTAPAGKHDSEDSGAMVAAAEAQDSQANSSKVAADARAALRRLHRELLEAEERVVTTNAAQLLEANGHLVVSTLRAQTAAELSAKELASLSRSADLDPLTDLPNRALLHDRFRQAMAHAKRDSTLLALLYLDLDNFKQINDTLGHAVGDEALKRAAGCLLASVRSGDTVSRFGGDEFVILLVGVTQASDAVIVAEKVMAALASPSAVGNHVLRLSTSIGISVYPTDGDTADTLLDRADAAMYLAKKHGVGRFVFHSRPVRT